MYSYGVFESWGYRYHVVGVMTDYYVVVMMMEYYFVAAVVAVVVFVVVFVVTYFLFPTIIGFDEMGLNVFKMVTKSTQFFATDAVPYNEPRQQHHTGPEYIQKYIAPPLKQHFMTICFVIPVFLIFALLLIIFDRHRISQR